MNGYSLFNLATIILGAC